MEGSFKGPGGGVRAAAEERELRILAPQAALSRNSLRLKEEEPCPFRTAFQRDRDRIIHSKAFRRLAYKTQVFTNQSGDHYRTRLTHTLEVSQIARTLAKALNLNEDLTEAIALGHDLGHAPFGHSGERVLNRLHPGGFTHQDQGLRVVDLLDKDFHGLNLTLEVRDGILKHSKGRGPIFARNGGGPVTLEGQLVRISDIIGYLAHDLDDALRAGLIQPGNMPPKFLAAFGPRNSTRIGAMVGDLLNASQLDSGRIDLAFSPAMEENMLELREFLFNRVYQNQLLAETLSRSDLIIEELYLAFAADRDLLLEYYPAAARADGSSARDACDFVASMTDRYAQALHLRLFPKGAGSNLT